MSTKNLPEIVQECFALEAEDAKSAGKLGYMARAIIQATLPHKAVASNEFVRENGFFSLTIMAPSKVGLPYGSIPRLLLSWLTTEAFYTRSPVLTVGPTLSAFMAELGLSRQGGKRGDITRFRKQAESLFASQIYLRYENENKIPTDTKNLRVSAGSSIWWKPREPDQLPLWQSTVTLSSEFFEEIIERPVPVDMAALKALKRSPLALDIYLWLTYRMSYLQRDTVIPWELLQRQFGADYAQDAQGHRDFKKFFIKRLGNVIAIYEKARVAPMERGLLLKPSPPHVAKRPFIMPEGKKVQVPAPPPLVPIHFMADSALLLKTETFEKAKRAAPGLDVYYLESEWREWMAQKSKRPENPDAAFIGFCKRKAKQHGGA